MRFTASFTNVKRFSQVDGPDQVLGGLHERAVLLLALEHRALGPLEVGHVEHQALHQQLAVLADDHGGHVAHPEHAAVAGDHPVLRAQLVAPAPAAGSSSSITRSRSSGWMLLDPGPRVGHPLVGRPAEHPLDLGAHERPVALLAEGGRVDDRRHLLDQGAEALVPRGERALGAPRSLTSSGGGVEGACRRRPRSSASQRQSPARVAVRASKVTSMPCVSRARPERAAGVGEVLGVEQLEPVAPGQLLAGPAERALERRAR